MSRPSKVPPTSVVRGRPQRFLESKMGMKKRKRKKRKEKQIREITQTFECS